MKKSICFVVSAPITVNAFLRQHIEELAKTYDIFIVANMEKSKDNSFENLPVQEVIHVPIIRKIKPFKDLLALQALTKIFKDKKFSAVHSVTPKAGLLAMLAAKRAGIVNRIHIFTGQIWHTKRGVMKNLLKSLDKVIVNAATNILVDGKSQRDFLIENSILTNSNSLVLGMGSISGVNVSRFLPDERVRKKMRNELNFQETDVVFSFLGRMNNDKGIKELALAFNRLLDKYTNVKLLLIGYDEQNLTKFIKDNVKSIGSVIFYGPSSKPEEILQASDVFCMPSHREGFGTSVLEASLLGLPLICSDTYGLQETMADELTGIRHEVGSLESLYKAMDYFYKYSDLRKKMGEAGRQYVLENFTSEQITGEWVKFYRELLGH